MKIFSAKRLCIQLWSFFIVAVFPFFLSAAEITPTPGNTPSANTTSGGININLFNPIKVDSIEDFLVTILNIIIVIATPIVVIFIIYSGFKYVMARGNASEIEEATKSLTYAIIGGVLIIGAVAIATIIGNLVGAFASQ